MFPSVYEYFLPLYFSATKIFIYRCTYEISKQKVCGMITTVLYISLLSGHVESPRLEQV